MTPSDSAQASQVVMLTPVFSDEEAERLVGHWHDHTSYGLYSNEGFETRYAPEVPQRWDAAGNFVRTGGRLARQEPLRIAAARTNYFRETYVYGDDVRLSGSAWMMGHEGLCHAAQRVFDRPIIEPAIVYANILVPGQELAVHTDVPEFRGVNRKVVPQWLLVAMSHSGLFERWRIHIATAITYVGSASGGELAYYPEGVDGDVAVHTPAHNSAVVMDTDRIFHGVDRVHGDDEAVVGIRPGARLVHEGDGRWTVHDGDRQVAAYRTDELRYSASWKAYCFADGDERDAWASGTDELTLEVILDALEADLRDRNVLDGPRPGEGEFAQLLIDTYIHFPPPSPSSAASLE